MVTLEMILDASGVQRGASDAERAFDGVGRAAQRAGSYVDGIYNTVANRVDRLGDAAQRAGSYVDGIYNTLSTRTDQVANRVGRLGDAFQSVGGSIQVGQGLTQTLAALERADLSSAGTNLARTLLEISQTGQNFRNLAGGVSATGGAFAALRGIMAAHPILAAAAVIGLVSSAIGLFTKDTKEATAATNEWAKAQERLKSSIDSIQDSDALTRVRERTGGQVSPQDAVRSRISAIESALANLDKRPGSSIYVDELSKLTDTSVSGLRAQFNRDPRVAGNPDGEYLYGRELAIKALEDRLRRLNQIDTLQRQPAPNDAYQSALGAFQRGAPQPNLDAIGGRGSTLAQFGPTEADRAKQEAAYDSLQQQMEELRAVGEEVGRTFAAAFESVVSGASSARDAVAGLARQLGSQVLQSAFAKFGGQIAGSFARSGEPPTRQRAPGES